MRTGWFKYARRTRQNRTKKNKQERDESAPGRKLVFYAQSRARFDRWVDPILHSPCYDTLFNFFFLFVFLLFPYAQPTSVLLFVTVNCKCKLIFVLSTLKIHFIHTPSTFSHIVVTIIVVVINKSLSSSRHQEKNTMYHDTYIYNIY